jgi:hypothetical protein
VIRQPTPDIIIEPSQIIAHGYLGPLAYPVVYRNYPIDRLTQFYKYVQPSEFPSYGDIYFRHIRSHHCWRG